jgi:hypothetical protein
MELTISLPDELQGQVEAAALAEGKTMDELAAELLQRHLDRRSLERFKQRGDLRRQGMSDDQVQNVV